MEWSKNIPKTESKTGDEYECFSRRARKWHSRPAGGWKAVKQRVNRRIRRHIKQELKQNHDY